MKFLNLSTFVLLLVVVFTSCKKECGDGSLEDKELDLPQITGVVNHTINRVTINQASEQKIEVSGYSDILEKKLTSSVNSEIVTFNYSNYKDYCNDDFSTTEINVSLPIIDYVKLDHTGNIYINNLTEQGNLTLENNYTGNIDFNSITGTESMDIKVLSTGYIRAFGDLPDLQNLNVLIDDTGNYEGFSVETVDCTVVSNGTGKCEIFVTGELNVTIDGTGNVYYKGNPTNINLTNNGTGELIDAN